MLSYCCCISNNCGQLTDDRTSPLNVHLFSVSLPNTNGNSNNNHSNSNSNCNCSSRSAAKPKICTACVRIVNCLNGRAGQTNPQNTPASKQAGGEIYFIYLYFCLRFSSLITRCPPFGRCMYDSYLCMAMAMARRQFYKKIEQPEPGQIHDYIFSLSFNFGFRFGYDFGQRAKPSWLCDPLALGPSHGHGQKRKTFATNLHVALVFSFLFDQLKDASQAMWGSYTRMSMRLPQKKKSQERRNN